MKSKNLLSVLFTFLFVSALTMLAKSQTCNAYYSLSNGNEFEMTNYNAKDKVTGKTINKISDVTTTTEGTMAKVETTTKNEKDEVEATTNSSIKCNGDKMYIEMKSFLPAQSSKQFEGMDIKSDATWMELPQNLTVGMTLQDATGTISMYSNGTLFSTMKITVSNRKVESQESITTTAGTYTCYKITQDMTMETITMGITIPVNIKSVEYHAVGVGSVKTESYNKDGKLMGYSMLTKVTKL
ncbi:MAG TPA: hypothetical protein PKK00_07990 [Bacteroidales bacterium]|nr:hypothetical protein [Bacteroidales bacterium]HPS17279.1 hypothetical protein [Bacteroidales bacterium]